MIIKKLNRRQIKWTKFFVDFDFVIFYQTKKMHVKTNSLIKRSDDKSIFENDDRQKHQLQTILTSDRLNVRIKKNLNELYFNEITKISKNLINSIDFHINAKKNEFESTKNELLQKFFISENKRLDIIKKMHNQFAVNHFDIKKIIQILQKNFQWLKMRANIDQYIRNCHVCKRSKVFKNDQHDQLQSIFVKKKSWQNISLNFVTNLSKNKNHDVIFMIVNWFSKMRHYIVCRAEKKDISIEKTIKLLIWNVWKLYELSKTIISNRNFQFVLLTWQFLCKILNIQIKLSITFHSEIDNQSEICNQKMKQYLRIYVNYQQDDWSNWLFMTKYVSNATNSATIKLSSFFINYEFQFRMSFESIETKSTAKKKFWSKKRRTFISIWKKFNCLHKKISINHSKIRKNMQINTKKQSRIINQKTKYNCRQKTSKRKNHQKNLTTNN